MSDPSMRLPRGHRSACVGSCISRAQETVLRACRPRFCNNSRLCNSRRMNATKFNRKQARGLVSATPTGQPLGTPRGGENRPQQAQVQGVEIGPTPKGVERGNYKKTPILTRHRSCRINSGDFCIPCVRRNWVRGPSTLEVQPSEQQEYA
ncbi:unnamed protein product [Ectocarpus sp. 6 AP-2014]